MSRLRIAHLSDPHFGTILPGVREGLLETLSEIKPDLVLLTGDITQRARSSQFAQAKDFTHRLGPVPMVAVPGNHDIPLFNLFARLFHPYRGFQTLFKDQLEKDFVYGDVGVVGLNSTSRWRHIQGDFNLKRLEQRLRAYPHPCKVRIAAFHHPMDCAKQSDEANLLRGRLGAMELFDKYQIDLVLGGHIHDPFAGVSSVRYPSPRRALVVGVAGTCLSWRTRPGAPNSFNFIEVDTSAAPKLSVVRFDQRADLRFTPERESRFCRFDAAGWVAV